MPSAVLPDHAPCLPQSPPPLSCSPCIGEVGSGLRVKALSSDNKLGFTPPSECPATTAAMELNLVWTLALTLALAALISISFLLPVFNRTNKSVTVNATVKREGPFSIVEVAKHNKQTDLWIILKNKVYDVTSYVEEHPGGEAIMNNAGADSTEGFFGPQHGTKVFEMLDDFYIGELAQ